MYVRSHFEEARTDVMHQLMRAHPLGAMVTLGSGGLDANHVPFEMSADGAPYGTLRAHLPRNNPAWREHAKGMETLVIFQGPQSYISPSLYATKKEDARVVPTYNFMVVHAYGPLRVIDDAGWVRAHLERLTDAFEAGRAQPWKVTDAPDDYIEKMLTVLVGIEIPITKLAGKWKVSQNQPEINRGSVERGLRAAGDVSSVAMADAVACR